MAVVKEVNPHFEDFIFNWDYKTYLTVGGYGSSKSYHVALKILLKCIEEKRKVLVIREVFETIRDSTYALFEELIADLELEGIVKPKVSPMRIDFPNGSQIIFKGMDKPWKLKSIHNVTIIWIEEASELKYEGYKELLGRARHPSLSIHFLLSTNPVGEDNWVYRHFFKDELKEIFVLDDEELYEKRVIVKNGVYYHHSIADDNLFLPQSYIDQLEELKVYDPDLYRIARRGRFGVNGKRVLPQFEVKDHEYVMSKVGDIPKRYLRNGMDFGFVVSYNALLKLAIDHENKWLYIYKEYYKNDMTDDKTAKDLEDVVDKDELIIADSAEPKSITYYNQQGFKMIGATKGPGSRLQNTKKVKRFKKIICSDKCKNTIRELKNLTYAVDKQGNIIEDEFNIDPHTFEAIWYGLDGYEVSDLKDRKNYSGKGRR
ncbi:PBSX family phage terminase large subunit [Tissierella sp.]|uniref:PBSX family phage terminase large subunit n=1 Tax=Tissierella sp. TaxID=41274 RepID=UPI0028A63740|nr:PBSX family phage terminase large subunit [Tissierella sp.]